MLALFFRVPQPHRLGLFLPSEKQAKGEPKHSPEREQVPCACAWPHTKALQSLVRVKKCKLTKPCVSIQLPFRMGGQLCLQRRAPGLDALCNLQLDGRKSGSHGIPTENTSLSKHEVTVCTL